jgi:hypothetical protein
MYACNEFDEFGQCLNWVEVTTLLPALSTPDALALSTAISVLWATAWVWSKLRDAV